MTRFYNSRPCNGTATHSNELSETLWMPKCQPAPTRVLLTKSTPYPTPGVLDTEMLPAVCLCLHSLHGLHTFWWPDHTASQGSLWPPHLQPHPLSGRSGKPAGRKQNQCTRASQRSKYALKLNLVPSLCQWITESAQEAMVYLRSSLCSLVSSAPQETRSWCLLFYLMVWEGSKANCDQPSLERPSTLCQRHLRTQHAYWAVLTNGWGLLYFNISSLASK